MLFHNISRITTFDLTPNISRITCNIYVFRKPAMDVFYKKDITHYDLLTISPFALRGFCRAKAP